MVDDDIKAPRHYAGDGKIEAKHAMRSMMHGVHMPSYISSWWFATFKYLWRWPHKNGLQDLYKARESLNNLIDAVESESK